MPHVHVFGSGGDVPTPPLLLLLLLLLLANALETLLHMESNGMEWNGMPVPIWNEQRENK